MAIPEHVKKLAMDAVNQAATTAQIRLYSENDLPIFSPPPEKIPPVRRGVLTDALRREAMDAVSNKTTLAQIRLIEVHGTPVALSTPSRASGLLANRIGAMHQTGEQANLVHQRVTKDGFGRDHE